MNANRYVQSRAIKEAVKGREAEVLEALQIDWRSGQPHIHLPLSRPPRRQPELAMGQAEKLRILQLHREVPLYVPRRHG